MSARIRTWLIRQPRPATVRVSSGKEKHEVSINGEPWSQVAQTVASLAPSRIDALDADGRVLRSVDASELEEPAPDAAQSGVPPSATAAGAVTDPESQRFTLVANLLAEAYRHSTTIAFEKLVEITNAQARRAESLERTINSIMKRDLDYAADQRAEAEEAAAEAAAAANENPLAPIAQAFMSGMAGAPAAPATNGKAAPPNGKA